MASSNDCLACCEALDCRADALESNITLLFQRTDDINNYLTENPSGYFTVVTTEEELVAALLVGGIIIQDGIIEFTGSHDITVDDTEIWFGTSWYPYNGEDDRVCFVVKAQGVKFWKVKFDMEQPLTPFSVAPGNYYGSTWHKSYPIIIGTNYDCSRFSVTECQFVDFFIAIYRSWARNSSTPIQFSDHCIIKDNTFIQFRGAAIVIQGYMRWLEVANNKVRGWNVDFATTPGADVNTMAMDDSFLGNGMWIGNRCDFIQCYNNTVCQVDRHGMEYWNSQQSESYPSGYMTQGNMMGRFHGNNLYQIKGFGLSVFGADGGIAVTANMFLECASYALELYNDNINRGRVFVIGNFIDRTIQNRTLNPDDGSLLTTISAIAISINNVHNGKISDNYIGLVKCDIATILPDNQQSAGMKLAHPSSSRRGVVDIEISNNKFVDAGRRMLWVEQSPPSGGQAYAYNLCIDNNKFTAVVTDNIPSGASYGYLANLVSCKVVFTNNKGFLYTSGGTDPVHAASPFYFDYGTGGSCVFGAHEAEAAMVASGLIYGSNITVTF